MNRRDYWSAATNARNGDKFEAKLDLLRISHNGGADIDSLIDSGYGAAYAQLLDLGFRFEEQPTGRAINDYYRSLGLRRQMFENHDYYTRWLLITPEELEDEAAAGRRYPLVFVNHGGFCSISDEEFLSGLPAVASDERIMVAMLQNTNWENTDRVLDRLIELYPVDTERVYMIGESQGACQITSTSFRIPERFAAVVTCGHEIYRDWDNFNVPFTADETAHLTSTFLPFMQINGQFEASSPAPVNDWYPRKNWGRPPAPEPFRDPRRDDRRDPTRVLTGQGRFSEKPQPPIGVDKHEWSIGQLNKMLATLGCTPRDPRTCISYLDEPPTDLHRILGFYGDRERIELHHDYRHYAADIDRADGTPAFRYVVVENAPHCWPATAGRLGWEFLRRFRRDSTTGEIVVERD